MKIDGTKYNGQKFELLPGRHFFVARFRLKGDEIAPNVGKEFEFNLVCELGFAAEAGRHYELTRVRIDGDKSGSSKRYLYAAELKGALNERGKTLLATCWWE